MNMENRRTVWIVSDDGRKDFSAAEKFGILKSVYSGTNPSAAQPGALVKQARRVLGKAEDGDYLLMVGDPTLCALCGAVIAEMNERLRVLKWDRHDQEYVPVVFDLTYNEEIEK